MTSPSLLADEWQDISAMLFSVYYLLHRNQALTSPLLGELRAPWFPSGALLPEEKAHLHP